jgi:hypothetical protein
MPLPGTDDDTTTPSSAIAAQLPTLLSASELDAWFGGPTSDTQSNNMITISTTKVGITIKLVINNLDGNM